MAEALPNQQSEPVYYALDQDPSILSEAERDPHLDQLIRSLHQAEDIANRKPDHAPYRHVADEAENTLNAWIERKGYARTLTSEWPPEE